MLTNPNLYDADGCRLTDERARAKLGLSGIELMMRAARAAFDVLVARYPQAHRLSVWCGKGNNAGDAYLIAAFALDLGFAVELIAVSPVESLTGDAAVAAQRAIAAGIVPAELSAGHSAGHSAGEKIDADVIVDGLIGTGFKPGVRTQFSQAMQTINSAAVPVLSVDVPSGVDVSTGDADQDAIQAEVTVTFITHKVGLQTGAGKELAGDVVFAGLGVSDQIYPEPQARRRYFRVSDLPPIGHQTYKHAQGHVLVVGGDYTMAGAVVLASRAALRCGAGLVTVATRPEHAAGIVARTPEVMVVDVEQDQFHARLESADLVVLGPGLGRDPWGRQAYERVQSSGRPTVIDADGLYLLSAQSWQGGALFLTPHAAEAARLLACTVSELAKDRVGGCQAIAHRYEASVALKGPGTVVCDRTGSTPEICQHGNSGMASAGMGDVLAGVVGGVLAGAFRQQRSDTAQLFATAVALHSAAADQAAARFGLRSLIAGDVIDALPIVLSK